ncbi:MAG: transcription factor S [Euryarchaeota archaeon]|nr:transcription factor S [Euryarchaeota archaeon]MBU4138535.1 transcription factor S [Euryarchaeota archaeon]
MEFCPKCKSMMMPANNVYKCRKCGFEKDIKESVVSKTERKEREVTVLEQREMGLPTIRAKCEDCGNDTAYWWMRQLRSADESEVRFFRCTKCGKTWRSYN